FGSFVSKCAVFIVQVAVDWTASRGFWTAVASRSPRAPAGGRHRYRGRDLGAPVARSAGDRNARASREFACPRQESNLDLPLRRRVWRDSRNAQPPGV